MIRLNMRNSSIIAIAMVILLNLALPATAGRTWVDWAKQKQNTIGRTFANLVINGLSCGTLNLIAISGTKIKLAPLRQSWYGERIPITHFQSRLAQVLLYGISWISLVSALDNGLQIFDINALKNLRPWSRLLYLVEAPNN